MWVSVGPDDEHKRKQWIALGSWGRGLRNSNSHLSASSHSLCPPRLMLTYLTPMPET